MPAKKPAAKKAAPKKVEPRIERPEEASVVKPIEAPVAEKPVEAPVERPKDVVAELRSDDIVTFVIPTDPGMEHQVWERSINGHILRLRRGVELSLPRYLVDFIRSRIKIQVTSDEAMARYTAGKGVKLNF